MKRVIRNPEDYHGSLVGFEVEAYASRYVTEADEVEDKASLRSLRRVARRLRELTGLPFKAIADVEGVIDPLPTSSPLNPVWAVKAEYDLDPLGVPNDDFTTGVEIITPPLEARLAADTAKIVAESMVSLGDFAPGLGSGFHINVSVPNLAAADAPGIALIDPFRRHASSQRLEEFADPLFDSVMVSLVMSPASSGDLLALIAELIRQTRGRYMTNALPLLTGRGYVEFRHLRAVDFFKRPQRVVDLANCCVDLLLDLPKSRIQSRVRELTSCAGRIRELGGAGLAEAIAQTAGHWAYQKSPSNEESRAQRIVLDNVCRLVKHNKDLLRRFPWAAAFPYAPYQMHRRRNKFRFPYAMDHADLCGAARTLEQH